MHMQRARDWREALGAGSPDTQLTGSTEPPGPCPRPRVLADTSGGAGAAAPGSGGCDCRVGSGGIASAQSACLLLVRERKSLVYKWSSHPGNVAHTTPRGSCHRAPWPRKPGRGSLHVRLASRLRPSRVSSVVPHKYSPVRARGSRHLPFWAQLWPPWLGRTLGQWQGLLCPQEEAGPPALLWGDRQTGPCNLAFHGLS